MLHDLLVIGGGINGVGIAADAAGRGLDVVLCEKSDLASATSSWSTKLIHGGLRYLEHYEFGLVRKSLRERELLAGAAPHIITPLAFHIPQLPGSRHPWLIRAGLFLYDHLATRKRFPSSRSVRFEGQGPLKQSIRAGFEYWDARVDDSRLVVLNALQARRKGARILTHHECVELREGADGWEAVLQDRHGGGQSVIKCRALINASGPWVSTLAEKLTKAPAPHAIRLVKGSHIIVPRQHAGEQALLLQHDDGRIVFVIPYLERYSLIGTTEQEFSGDLDQVHISAIEIDYLVDIVNQYLDKPLGRDDVLGSFAGVRPLIDGGEQSASQVSRDYRIELEQQPFPLMSIYGGKVTTYRVLAEDALKQLRPVFPSMGPDWTGNAVLPGGEFSSMEQLLSELQQRYGWMPVPLLQRLATGYGSMTPEVVGDADSMAAMGPCFGADLTRREVDYLWETEWARSSDDILWRRSKLGYAFEVAEEDALRTYLQQRADLQ